MKQIQNFLLKNNNTTSNNIVLHRNESSLSINTSKNLYLLFTAIIYKLFSSPFFYFTKKNRKDIKVVFLPSITSSLSFHQSQHCFQKAKNCIKHWKKPIYKSHRYISTNVCQCIRNEKVKWKLNSKKAPSFWWIWSKITH